MARNPTELERYQGLEASYCEQGYAWQRNCPADRKKACKAIRLLVSKLETGKATSRARDAVRESMRRLDRCRVKSGERLSLYGLKRRSR